MRYLQFFMVIFALMNAAAASEYTLKDSFVFSASNEQSNKVCYIKKGVSLSVPFSSEKSTYKSVTFSDVNITCNGYMSITNLTDSTKNIQDYTFAAPKVKIPESPIYIRTSGISIFATTDNKDKVATFKRMLVPVAQLEENGDFVRISYASNEIEIRGWIEKKNLIIDKAEYDTLLKEEQKRIQSNQLAKSVDTKALYEKLKEVFKDEDDHYLSKKPEVYSKLISEQVDIWKKSQNIAVESHAERINPYAMLEVMAFKTQYDILQEKITYTLKNNSSPYVIEACHTCSGSRHIEDKKTHKYSTCPKCKGKGETEKIYYKKLHEGYLRNLKQTQNDFDMFMQKYIATQLFGEEMSNKDFVSELQKYADCFNKTANDKATYDLHYQTKIEVFKVSKTNFK